MFEALVQLHPLLRKNVRRVDSRRELHAASVHDANDNKLRRMADEIFKNLR